MTPEQLRQLPKGYRILRMGRWSGVIAIGSGVIWVRKNNKEGYKLSAPWHPALFSERYGYTKPLWKFLGFRLFKLEA